MNTELFELVARVVFEVTHNQIQPSDLKLPIAEMDIDSVELMEIFGMLEEELGTCLPEDQIAEVSTFEDLMRILLGQNRFVSEARNG